MQLKNLAWTTLPLAATVQAISLGERISNPSVVALPIQKSRDVRDTIHSSRFRRRQATVSETLDNAKTTYYALVDLGTPAQQLQLHIDTGSSDMWVNEANSTLCQSAQNACSGGTYNPTLSSTYQYVNNAFNISYVDGSYATGDYAIDTMSVAGQTLTNFQFAIGEVSGSSAGVLGVGYAAIEAQVDRSGLSSYPNLPQAMVNAGLINANAYSLFLNDLGASSGTILFGGVDTSKYTGTLASVPVIQINGLYLVFAIALSGLTIGNTDLSGSSSIPFAVILDSGSTLSYLPTDLANNIYQTVGAVYDSNSGAAYVDCSTANQNFGLDFTFSGQTIIVPYNEMVLQQATSSDGTPLTFQNGNPACLFGIAPAQGSTPILGDSFLRSAYVVYDLDNNEISLAQTNFNGGAAAIREITRSGVPGAAAVASPVTTLAATTGARIGSPTVTITNAPTPQTGTGVRSKEMSMVLAALVAVGVVFVMF